jgi:hypothetical protein
MVDQPNAGTDLDKPSGEPGQVPDAADHEAVRYARLSGVMGIVFAALFVVGLVLVHRSPSLALPDADYAQFYADGGQHVLVTAGTSIMPFAGIAFLWHMTTIRLLVRARTPAPPAIPEGLQLLSGAMFVILLLAGIGAAGATALLMDLTDAPLSSVGVARALSGLGYGLVFVYAIRGAGMYAITTTTLLRKAGILSRWVAVLGYVAAAVLLVSTTYNPLVVLVFPAWVVLVSVEVLIRAGRPGDRGSLENGNAASRHHAVSMGYRGRRASRESQDL